MTVYVGSLKFSPVFKSHCCAFGKACEEEGYNVKYLFSREYEWMLSEKIKENTIFIGNSQSISSMIRDSLNFRNKKIINQIFEDNPTAIYLHNYHFLNNYIAKHSKKNGCAFIYHVHEPHVENKRAHGGLQQYWLHLFEYFQGKLLNNTDIAIVSSKFASSLFEKRYPTFSGKKMLIPLLFEDLGKTETELSEREYVTFVGPPVPAKNPEKFLDIVSEANKKNLGLKFLLISRSEITDPKYFVQKNLQIISNKRTTDEDFGRLIRRSISVLTPYKRETQSSVILVSYMYGTPVITSDVGGLSEFVINGKTGFFLPLTVETDKWLEQICSVKENLQKLSMNCRKYFVDNFSGKKWKQFLPDLF